MTDLAVHRTRTGGPSGPDHDTLVEQAIGWVLAIVMAMLTVRLGLF
jgi:hypothetical protein